MNSQVNKPRVSVIIPVYSTTETFLNCIRPILNSHFESHELIVVDDASPLDVEGALHTLSSSEIVTVRHQKRRGVAAARNTGASQAKGEILVFVDSDVIVEKDSISSLVQTFSDEAILIAQGVVRPLERGQGIAQTLAAGIWYFSFNSKYHRTNILNSFFFAVRRSYLKKLGFFDEQFDRAGGEEFELAARVCQNSHIHYDTSIQVTHQFKPFIPYTRNIFMRMKFWVPLYFSKRKQSSMFQQFSYRHFVQAINPFLCLASLFLLPFALFNTAFLYLSALPFIVQLGLQIDLYTFLTRKYGLVFTVKSIIINSIWHLVIGFGLIYSLIFYLTRRSERQTYEVSTT